MCLNTQETDVQKLQDKLNSGHIEEVIVQVKRGNLRLGTKGSSDFQCSFG